MLGESRVLHESEYYKIERFKDHGVVLITRLGKPFQDAADVERACRPVQDTLNFAGRSKVRLLIDSRGVVGRNDPASEANFSKHRKEMARGFVRVAILVQTTIGLLHAKRLLVEDGSANVMVFLDEALAVAYLTEPITSR